MGQAAALPSHGWWLLAVALVVSALGFYRTVFFVSIGYAFSVVGMGLLALVLFRDSWSWGPVLQTALLVVYGWRLGMHVARREWQPAYRELMRRDPDRPVRQPLGVSLAIWVSVSLLYLLMVSPAWFGLADGVTWGGGSGWLATVGLVVMAGGLALEWVADRQKALAKAADPSQFCHTGLYRISRCPNYFGEILVWLGCFVAGLPAYAGWLRWLMASVGLVCLVLIMIGSTKRLEQSQDARYGDRPDYQAYVRTVPVLVPFVPVHSLRHVRAPLT